METRQRHYVNRAVGGECVFVTATCLDFAHAFRSSAAKDAALLTLLDVCHEQEAVLNAFVIMSNHVHLLIALPVNQNVSQFVGPIKSEIARTVRPGLSAEELQAFSDQTGLNRRVFWQRSFRSLTVSSGEAFRQKVRYIHENPVRAGLCATVDAYAWSSARDWEGGFWSSDTGLDIASVQRRFK